MRCNGEVRFGKKRGSGEANSDAWNRLTQLNGVEKVPISHSRFGNREGGLRSGGSGGEKELQCGGKKGKGGHGEKMDKLFGSGQGTGKSWARSRRKRGAPLKPGRHGRGGEVKSYGLTTRQHERPEGNAGLASSSPDFVELKRKKKGVEGPAVREKEKVRATTASLKEKKTSGEGVSKWRGVKRTEKRGEGSS